MIRVNQVKIKVEHTKEQLVRKTADVLRVSPTEIQELKIVRQSIDARKKPDVFYSYTVDVKLTKEDKVIKKLKNNNQVSIVTPVEYQFPKGGTVTMQNPVVIIGTGPAGLFCGYYLALHGYKPILLERGKAVDDRQADVEKFWEEGVLDPQSNVQFGEGGAGTFSDGKLNTLVKDKDGRNKAVLETFVRFGAKDSIVYDAKPHIGTDVLCKVVKGMREEIIRLGGQVRFEAQVTDICIEDNQVCGVVINEEERLDCSQVILAIGHSARDTFSMLYNKGIPMEAKSFAVGFRVEHPQSMINESQYGSKDTGVLGAAPYKVTAQTSVGRGVYSFCMCPGGYVVNASSEEGRLAVNGMSYSRRDGSNANSAIIVAVTPEDFGSDHPLAGIEFQRGLEERAYRLAKGRIPASRYGVFRKCVQEDCKVDTLLQQDNCNLEQLMKKSICDAKNLQDNVDTVNTEFNPATKGAYAWADLTSILPKECNQAFVEGMESFGRQIKGFNRKDAIMLGVESRTSSPVRIHRDEELQSDVKGLYPCGEGAGYAGGITSAAMDGMRIAEQIAVKYAPFQE